MLRLYFAALVLVFICAVLAPPPAATPATVAQLRFSAVQVETDGARGSGVVVTVRGRDAFVLTAAHVVPDGEAATALFWHQDEAQPAHLVAREPDVDLALLRVTGAPVSVRPVKRARATPPAGSQVVAVGSPLGLQFAAQYGWIAQEAFSPVGGSFVALDFPPTKGTSGAAMCTMDGRMFGVMSAGLRLSRLCLAIPIGRIEAFLEANLP